MLKRFACFLLIGFILALPIQSISVHNKYGNDSETMSPFCIGLDEKEFE